MSSAPHHTTSTDTLPTDRLWPEMAIAHTRDRHGITQVVAVCPGMPARLPGDPTNLARPVEVHEHALAAGMRRAAYLDTCADTVAAWERFVRPFRVGVAHTSLAEAEEVRAALASAGIAPHMPVLCLTGQASALRDDFSLSTLLRALSTALAPGSFIGLQQPCGANMRRTYARLARKANTIHHTRTVLELEGLLAGCGLTRLVGPHPAWSWPRPEVPLSGSDVLSVLAAVPGGEA